MQLPKLSDSEVFSVQHLTAEQANTPFSPYITQLHSDKAAGDLCSGPKPYFESIHFTQELEKMSLASKDPYILKYFAEQSRTKG